MGLLIGLAIIAAIVLYNAFAWGYVASVFYGWFVLPYFPSFPHFTATHFIGFVLFIGVMTHKGHIYVKDEYQDKTNSWVQLFLGPWISLAAGCLVHQFFF